MLEASRQEPADAPARGEFRLDEALSTPQRRRLRQLPGLIGGAVALVWRAAPRELLITSGLQLVSSVGLGAQLLVSRNLLEHILAGQQDGYGAAAPDIAILAGIIGIVAISNAARSEIQRTLGELVARYATSRVIEISTAVDLLSFEVPAFHDRQQRAVVNATFRPVQMTNGLLGVLGGLLATIGVGLALLAIQPLLLLVVARGVRAHLGGHRRCQQGDVPIRLRADRTRPRPVVSAGGPYQQGSRQGGASL